jgi:hypothetical protein
MVVGARRDEEEDRTVPDERGPLQREEIHGVRVRSARLSSSVSVILALEL